LYNLAIRSPQNTISERDREERESNKGTKPKGEEEAQEEEETKERWIPPVIVSSAFPSPDG
jgi:hypothetical protein